MDKIAKQFKNCIISEKDNGIHVAHFDLVRYFRNSTVIVDGAPVSYSLCDKCRNRLTKLTSECYSCRFVPIGDIAHKSFVEPELEMEKVPFVYCCKDRINYFSDPVEPDELSFDEKNMQMVREELSIRAKTAARTRKKRKKFCSSCVFRSTHYSRSACDKEYFCGDSNTYFMLESELKERLLTTIKNITRWLRLAMLGNQVVYLKNQGSRKKSRYRIICPIDEEKEEFKATLDYYPFSLRDVTLEEIGKPLPKLNGLRNRTTTAAMLKLLSSTISRNNWIRITMHYNMLWGITPLPMGGVEIKSGTTTGHPYSYSFHNLKELCANVSYLYVNYLLPGGEKKWKVVT
jgi:hypothetical protein